MKEEKKIAVGFRMIKEGLDILWEAGYDYDLCDVMQDIVNNYYEDE